MKLKEKIRNVIFYVLIIGIFIGYDLYIQYQYDKEIVDISNMYIHEHNNNIDVINDLMDAYVFSLKANEMTIDSLKNNMSNEFKNAFRIDIDSCVFYGKKAVSNIEKNN